MSGEIYHDNLHNSEWFIGEPLDTLRIKINGRNGIQEFVPALHIGFMEIKEFMHFRTPPLISNPEDTENSVAEKDEWVESMQFLEDDLHWLLKLPHHRFWSQVVHDENVHKCLESYLSLAPRDYDLPGLTLSEEVFDVLKKIHKLVFLVFLRMSTYKESKEHHLRPDVFKELIYEHFIFDVPKIMDLCVLYGYQNERLLTKMIKNIFTLQPKYLNDLNDTCAVIFEGFNFAEKKLGVSSAENPSECRKLNDTSADVMNMTLLDVCEIMGYVADTSATVDILLEIYSPLCSIFYQNGAILRIATFYEQAFPVLEKLVKKFQKSKEETCFIEDLKRRIVLSKSFLIRSCRNILNFCCIQFILDPLCNEERVYRNLPTEEFIDIFMEIASEKKFMKDYNAIYPFENDLELINQTNASLDPDRLNYIFGSIYDLEDKNFQNFISTPENGALPKKRITQPVQSLQCVASILKPETAESSEKFNSEIIGVSDCCDEAQIESLIFNIKDIFPDLGEGFIEACLKHYSYNIEEVTNALCSGHLPESLKNLDVNMERKNKSVKSAPSVSAPVLSERRNVFDGDEFDIFTRDDVNTENIHLGKKNKTPNAYENFKDAEESEFIKNLILSYEENESDSEIPINIYEDEYDDTYDSAMVGLKESTLEDEPDKDEGQEEPEISNSIYDEPQPRPGEFCINPEILRQRRDAHMQAKAAARNKSGTCSSNNRQQKDRHKAQVANHNRKKQSDYKMSRGMMR